MKRCMGCMKMIDDHLKICPKCGYDPEKDKLFIALQPGTVLLGKYTIGKVIGQGGFGITYIGWDHSLGRPVAIKEYFPTDLVGRSRTSGSIFKFDGEGKEEAFEDGLKAFMEEARCLARFTDPDNIVKIYDAFQENTTGYIVMEYLEGMTLANYLKIRKKLPYQECRSILVQVLKALKTVHEANMIHRDVTPSNIFLTKDSQIKLIDFGSAREDVSTRTKSISVVLKMGYAPLEQYKKHGDMGPWTDLYAVGATGYKMLTGETPQEALERMDEDKLIPPSGMGIEIPPEDEAILMKALALKKKDRVQCADEMLAVLDQEEPGMKQDSNKTGGPKEPSPYPRKDFTADGKPIQRLQIKIDPSKNPIRPAMPEQPGKGEKKRWMWILILIVFLLLIGGIGFAAVRMGGHTDSEPIPAASPTPVPTQMPLPTPTPKPTPFPTATPMPTPIPLPDAIGTCVSLNAELFLTDEPGGKANGLVVPKGAAVSMIEETEKDGTDYVKVFYYGLEGWIKASEVTAFKASYDTIGKDSEVFASAGKVSEAVPAYNREGEAETDTLGYGETGTVMENNGQFARICLESGKDCWIDLRQVRPKEPGYYYVNTGKSLNVRKEPSVSGERVGSVGSKKLVEVLEIENGWGRTSEGYIAMCYLIPTDETYKEPVVTQAPVQNEVGTNTENAQPDRPDPPRPPLPFIRPKR